MPIEFIPIKPTVCSDVIPLTTAVVGTIVVKSSTALRVNSRCTGRHMEDLRNVHNTSLSSALSPSRMCGSIKAGVHCCPRGVHRSGPTPRSGPTKGANP